LRFDLAWQACWVLVGSFSESAFQSSSQGNARFPKLVAQAIRGRESALPALAADTFQQVFLFRFALE
jgi:hypothetical protein